MVITLLSSSIWLSFLPFEKIYSYFSYKKIHYVQHQPKCFWQLNLWSSAYLMLYIRWIYVTYVIYVLLFAHNCSLLTCTIWILYGWHCSKVSNNMDNDQNYESEHSTSCNSFIKNVAVKLFETSPFVLFIFVRNWMSFIIFQQPNF